MEIEGATLRAVALLAAAITRQPVATGSTPIYHSATVVVEQALTFERYLRGDR